MKLEQRGRWGGFGSTSEAQGDLGHGHPSASLTGCFRQGNSGIILGDVTLHATLCGQNFPKPRGGWILLSRVTTSRCLILPLREDTDKDIQACYSEHLAQRVDNDKWELGARNIS